MKIKLTELGRHEAWLRLSSIMKAGDEQVQLERKLASELLKNWRASYENALKGLFRQLPKEITKQAIEIITQSLSEALGHSFGSSQAVRDELRKYITKAYQAGKSEFGFKPDLKLPDIRAINILTKHNCYWLGEHFEKHIRERIAERTQEAIEDGIGRKELADQLRNDLGGEVGGYKYWDVASSAVLVRSRSFGCVSGMIEAGIVEYEILAMGDERMCPICGELDGKVYSVSEAQSRIDGALGIDSPEKFKEAFPWPPSTGERAVLPPFHGRCRCVLVMHESEAAVFSIPYVKPEDILSYDTNARIASLAVHSLPDMGLPGWAYDRFVRKKGIFAQRRYYDEQGMMILDIDFDDHSAAKAHPMGAHAHDYDGKSRSDPRELKEWEREILNKVRPQNKQLIEKSVYLDADEDNYVTIEEYKYIMEVSGREYGFIYDGHDYFTGYQIGHILAAWDCDDDDSYQEGFKDIDDMLDNYRVHTGETLREIIPKSVLSDNSPVSLNRENFVQWQLEHLEGAIS